MSEYVVICGQCRSGELHPVTDEWLNGLPIRGHYECGHCGARSGLWMDGGTLDLDQVREAVRVQDFEIFPAEPWTT